MAEIGLQGSYIPVSELSVGDYVYVTAANIPCRILTIGKGIIRGRTHIDFHVPNGVSISPNFTEIENGSLVFCRKEIVIG